MTLTYESDTINIKINKFFQEVVKQKLFVRLPDERFKQCPEALNVKFGIEVKG